MKPITSSRNSSISDSSTTELQSATDIKRQSNKRTTSDFGRHPTHVGRNNAYDHVQTTMGSEAKQLSKSVRDVSGTSEIGSKNRIPQSGNSSSIAGRAPAGEGQQGTAVRGNGTTELAASMWRRSMLEKGYKYDAPKTGSRPTTLATATVTRTAAVVDTTSPPDVDKRAYSGILQSKAQGQTQAHSPAPEKVRFDSEESDSSELSSTESETFSIPVSKPVSGQDHGPVIRNTINTTTPLTTTTATVQSCASASGSAATNPAFESDQEAGGHTVESNDHPGRRRRALTRQNAVKSKEGALQVRVSRQARLNSAEAVTASERSASTKVSAEPAMRSATPVSGNLSKHVATLRDIAEKGNTWLKSGNKTAAKDMVSLEHYLATDPPPTIITICAAAIGKWPPADYFEGLSRSNAKVAFVSDMLPTDPTDDDIKRLYEFGQLPQGVWDNREKIRIVGTNADQMQISLSKLHELQNRLSKAKKMDQPKMIGKARKTLKTLEGAVGKKTFDSIKNDVEIAHDRLKSAQKLFRKGSLGAANREFGTVSIKLVRAGKERAADETYKNTVERTAPAILDFCKKHPDYTVIYVGNVINLFDSVKDGVSRRGLNSLLFRGLTSNTGGTIQPIIFGGQQFEVTEINQKEAFEGTDIDEDGNEIRADFGVTSVQTSDVYLHIPESLYQ